MVRLKGCPDFAGVWPIAEMSECGEVGGWGGGMSPYFRSIYKRSRCSWGGKGEVCA